MADSQDTRTAPFSRRAVVAGLVATPSAALPTFAGVSSSPADPIFGAFAEFDRAKAADELASKAYEDLRAVTFDALEAAGVKPVEILTSRRLKLRHECGLLSNSEYAEALTALHGPTSEHQAMWLALEDLEEPAQTAAELAGAAERGLLQTAPTSRAGALRLLHHLADFLDGEGVINDAYVDDIVGDAIRNAIAVFESEVRS